MTEGDSLYSRRRTAGNAKIFIVGKIGSAALNVFWLGLLVRVLDLHDFASYIAAMATLEAGIALSSVGAEWLLLRLVPEYVVHGAQGLLGGLLRRALALRMLGALLTAGLGLLVMTVWRVPEPVAAAGIAPLLAVLLLSEACLRLLRDNALESLGRQGFTQLGVLLRTATLVLVAAWMSRAPGGLDIKTLLGIEVVVSLLTLAYAVLAVRHVLRRLPAQVEAGWAPAPFHQALKMAGQNYVSSLLNFVLSLQALLLLISSLGAGAQVLAAFGFTVRIVEILRGYLPALLLMNVLRPRFVALYAQSRNLLAVGREARLASRLSVVTVAPLIGIAALYGDTLLALASGGKIASGQWVLAGLTLSLMVRVNRMVTVVLVNCVDMGGLLVSTALLALPVLPVAGLLVSAGWPAAAILVAVAWDECVTLAVMVWGLRKGGHDWSGDWLFMLRVLVCAALACAATFLAQGPVSGLLGVVAGSATLCLLIIALLMATRTFRMADLAVLRA